MNEPLLNINAEMESLEKDFESYSFYVTKLDKDLNVASSNDATSSKNWVREFVPKVEQLGNYLGTINYRIKNIESEDNYNSKQNQRISRKVKEIKYHASTQFEVLNKKFIDIIKPKNQSAQRTESSKRTDQLNSSDFIDDAKVSQQLQDIRKASTISEKNSSFSKDRKEMRYEDLELLFKICNETLEISKQMKSSVNRAEGSINSIEANVLNVKDNLTNANKETTKLYNENKSSVSKYVWFFIIALALTIFLVWFLYYKISSSK